MATSTSSTTTYERQLFRNSATGNATRQEGSRRRRRNTPTWQQTCRCTHTTNVKRTYHVGFHNCDDKRTRGLVGWSPLPWVYVCEEDQNEYALRTLSKAPLKTATGLDAHADTDAKVEALRSLGSSPSVVKLASEGFYTAEQLDTIIEQKLRANQAIMVEIQMMRESMDITDAAATSTSAPSSETIISATGSNNHTAKNTLTCGPGAVGTSAGGSLQRNPGLCVVKCFKCLPSLPTLREKARYSFEAAIAGEIPPITADEVFDLPIADAAIVRTIGRRGLAIQRSLSDKSSTSAMLGSSPSSTISTFQNFSSMNSSSFSTLATNATDATDLTEEDNSSLKLFRTKSGLKTHYKRLSKLWRKRDSSSTQGSSVTLPIAGAGSLRQFDDQVDDFDVSHLRSEITDGGNPATFRAASVDTIRQDSVVSGIISKGANAGVEVPVDGGVALTEEAVEIHIPDVITEV